MPISKVFGDTEIAWTKLIVHVFFFVYTMLVPRAIFFLLLRKILSYYGALFLA